MGRQGVTRRSFLKGTVAAAAGTALSAIVHAQETPESQPAATSRPASRLRIAMIGCAGKGWGDVTENEIASQRVVALCDVDKRAFAKPLDEYPWARTYADYRVMIEKEKDNIDAVMIATPDHTHAVMSLTAMKLGKHVFCQKPLTHTVYEARQLFAAAKQYKVVTQMGIQFHANEGMCMAREWLEAGVIGPVREVHCWTDRPIWPQALDRPMWNTPMPEYLDWDLWLGPSPWRPYADWPDEQKTFVDRDRHLGLYHRFNWRGWWDFGSGAIGDMAIHNTDAAFWALGLGCPVSVEAHVSDCHPESGPAWSIVTYEFPRRGALPPVTLVWYDGITQGGRKPHRPPELEDHLKLPDKNGLIFIGETGKMVMDPHGGIPRLIPESRMKEFGKDKRPPRTLPRLKCIYGEWVRACKEGTATSANFEYAAPFTESLLLGTVACRIPKKKLLWDGPNLRFTNDEAANKLLHNEYRKGWTL